MSRTKSLLARWLNNWYISSLAWSLVALGWFVLFLLDYHISHIITGVASLVIALMFFLLARQRTQASR